MTPIGQDSSLSPVVTRGQSYFGSPLGADNGHDLPTYAAIAKEDRQTVIGIVGVTTTETTSLAGRSYRGSVFSTPSGHDLQSTPARNKEVRQFKVGLVNVSAIPEGTQSGLYGALANGVMTPIGGTGTTATVTYKLRARDSGTGSVAYVYWTSSILSVGSYPSSPPFGGPLVELTILAVF